MTKEKMRLTQNVAVQKSQKILKIPDPEEIVENKAVLIFR